jgi:hypothetical protein
MKTASFLLLSLLLLSGCANQYVMTLNNGTKLTTASKPKLEHGRYSYKDANGGEHFVPAGRVRQVEPQSMAQEDEKKNQFKPTPAPKTKHWYWPF